MDPLFVLVHSPSVGPATWAGVAERMSAAGHAVRVPSLLSVGKGAPPFWPSAAAAVSRCVADVPDDRPLVLVAHSNAGLFVPTVRAALPHPVAASVFVDAALPARDGATPVAGPELLHFLRPLAADGVLPRWTDWWDEADVAPMFADAPTRRAIVEEQPRLPLSYYEQAVPVPPGWDDHPCAYVLFGPPYEAEAREARARGWRVAHLPGEHLHQTVDPAATTELIMSLV
ncbi:alpha/beta hydrolase [Streptomyces sp. NPDC056132]|uniref:alpha/beta hydrolase n=1 Tax=Streptomyces sp. NPDC056132 TaxID=3345722 RepID=UPI0035E1C5C2